MIIREQNPQRLVLKSTSPFSPTTCILDKNTGVARVIRQLLLFLPRRIELPLSKIADVRVTETTDRRGAQVRIPLILTTSGRALALSVSDEPNAVEAAAKIRDFLEFRPSAEKTLELSASNLLSS